MCKIKISCIICSRQSDISVELKNNIASTIGCDYELVVIDNSKNKYSIFSAYNEGVHRAKGDILCFMHEDILFHTTAWGNNVLKYFEKFTHAGLLGVAGTHFISSIPGGWWATKIASVHLLRGFYNEKGLYTTKEENESPTNEFPTLLAAIDGLWMCMPKGLFLRLRWDEENFLGFHAYDMDMSLQVWNAGYEVHFYSNVLIEHKSMGQTGMDFHVDYEKLWSKWKDVLPMIKGVAISPTEQVLRMLIADLERKMRIQEFQIRSSYAYRLGKFILKPFSCLRNVLKCNKR